ncbi:hypothetical protein CsSME_00028843 [Camellia sinensis var. sinensis]
MWLDAVLTDCAVFCSPNDSRAWEGKMALLEMRRLGYKLGEDGVAGDGERAHMIEKMELQVRVCRVKLGLLSYGEEEDDKEV